MVGEGALGWLRLCVCRSIDRKRLRMLFRYWPQPEAAIMKLMLSYQKQFYSRLLAFSAQCKIYNDPPQNPPQIMALLEQWTNPETIIGNEVRVKTPAEAGRADKHGLTEETRRLVRDKIQLLLGPISLIFPPFSGQWGDCGVWEPKGVCHFWRTDSKAASIWGLHPVGGGEAVPSGNEAFVCKNCSVLTQHFPRLAPKP